jgi:phosphoribosylanthranilate isomerase
MTAIKVCGLSRAEDVSAVNAVLPHYAGWIFVPTSRRAISGERAARLRERLDPRIVPVGVFRDAPIDDIARLAKAGTIAAAQLHGHENQAYVAELRDLTGILVIKAVSVTGRASVTTPPTADKTSPTDPAYPADFLLFDNGTGGTGQPFDLGLIAAARRAGTLTRRPFFIAGGVSAATVGAILPLRPHGVDLNSGVETGGVKDPAKIRHLVEIIRAFDTQSRVTEP